MHVVICVRQPIYSNDISHPIDILKLYKEQYSIQYFNFKNISVSGILKRSKRKDGTIARMNTSHRILQAAGFDILPIELQSEIFARTDLETKKSIAASCKMFNAEVVLKSIRSILVHAMLNAIKTYMLVDGVTGFELNGHAFGAEYCEDILEKTIWKTLTSPSTKTNIEFFSYHIDVVNFYRISDVCKEVFLSSFQQLVDEMNANMKCSAKTKFYDPILISTSIRALSAQIYVSIWNPRVCWLEEFNIVFV